MFAEPAPYAARGSFPGHKRRFASCVINGDAEFTLQVGSTRGMIIVPVSKEDCLEEILRELDDLKTLKEFFGIGIHADVPRNRSNIARHEIRTGKIGRSAKTPYSVD